MTWLKADLEQEVERRNDARGDEQQFVVVEAPRNKKELAAALSADDERAESLSGTDTDGQQPTPPRRTPVPKPMRPDPAVTYGRENWIWVPAIANIQAPKLTEVTATSALDITDILFDASGEPTQSTNRVTAERRKATPRSTSASGPPPSAGAR